MQGFTAYSVDVDGPLVDPMTSAPIPSDLVTGFCDLVEAGHTFFGNTGRMAAHMVELALGAISRELDQRGSDAIATGRLFGIAEKAAVVVRGGELLKQADEIVGEVNADLVVPGNIADELAKRLARHSDLISVYEGKQAIVTLHRNPSCPHEEWFRRWPTVLAEVERHATEVVSDVVNSLGWEDGSIRILANPDALDIELAAAGKTLATNIGLDVAIESRGRSLTRVVGIGDNATDYEMIPAMAVWVRERQSVRSARYYDVGNTVGPIEESDLQCVEVVRTAGKFVDGTRELLAMEKDLLLSANRSVTR